MHIFIQIIQHGTRKEALIKCSVLRPSGGKLRSRTLCQARHVVIGVHVGVDTPLFRSPVPGDFHPHTTAGFDNSAIVGRNVTGTCAAQFGGTLVVTAPALEAASVSVSVVVVVGTRGDIRSTGIGR